MDFERPVPRPVPRALGVQNASSHSLRQRIASRKTAVHLNANCEPCGFVTRSKLATNSDAQLLLVNDALELLVMPRALDLPGPKGSNNGGGGRTRGMYIDGIFYSDMRSERASDTEGRGIQDGSDMLGLLWRQSRRRGALGLKTYTQPPPRKEGALLRLRPFTVLSPSSSTLPTLPDPPRPRGLPCTAPRPRPRLGGLRAATHRVHAARLLHGATGPPAPQWPGAEEGGGR